MVRAIDREATKADGKAGVTPKGSGRGVDARCAKHQFEPAGSFCRQCGHPFCVRCLVYPFGERKPPLCIPCALVASGVRSGKRPKATWKERRAQRKLATQPGAGPMPEPVASEPEVTVPDEPLPAFDSNAPLGDDPWYSTTTGGKPGDDPWWASPSQDILAD